jgi:hypothetical protein
MLNTDLFRKIAADYAPYDGMIAFTQGALAFGQCIFDNPHEGVNAQAWDRGLEAAMRFARNAE